jgi:sortase A
MVNNIRRRQLLSGLFALLIMTTVWHWSHAAVIYAKAHLAQWLIQSAWQTSLQTGQKTKPWPWADTWPVAKIVFHHQDNNNKQTPFYVLSGSTGNSLAFGPGHDVRTALPATEGASVIAGHRDTHFSLLHTIQTGSTLEVQNNKGIWKHYKVSEQWIADISTTPFTIDEGKNQLYLVTCYPFNTIAPRGNDRLVVRADLM